MKCLNLSNLIARHNYSLNKIKNQEIESHINFCPICKKRVEAYDHVREFVKRNIFHSKPFDNSHCYDESDLVSYLEGGLNRSTRTEYYCHFNQCASCLDKVVALDNMLHELKSEGLLPVKKGVLEKVSEIITAITNAVKDKVKSLGNLIKLPDLAYRWAGFAIILIAAGWLLIRQENLREMPFLTREPSVSKFEMKIQLLTPANRSTVETSRVEFRWTGPSDISFYNFMLLDANGDILWEIKASETQLALPPEIQLQSYMTYFWQVEGFFETGGSVVSEMVSFTYEIK